MKYTKNIEKSVRIYAALSVGDVCRIFVYFCRIIVYSLREQHFFNNEH